MMRIFKRPIPLALLLLFLSIIPIASALLRMVEILSGSLPDDAIKFLAVPVVMFGHALGGALFAVLGPVQFAGVLKRRFGRLHRITGRIFVVAGGLLALSSLRLLWQFPDTFTWVLTLTRLLAGLALGTALVIAITAIRRHQVARHKAWMIRAYAIGMGSVTVSFIMLPIFLINGEPLTGYAADLLSVASFAVNIGVAEWVIRRPMLRAGTAAAV